MPPTESIHGLEKEGGGLIQVLRMVGISSCVTIECNRKSSGDDDDVICIILHQYALSALLLLLSHHFARRNLQGYRGQFRMSDAPGSAS